MRINTTIKKYQDGIINIINQAATELPPTIVQLILQNILFQVDAQVNLAIQNEAMQDNMEIKNEEN